MISQYNTQGPPVQNLRAIVHKRLKLFGFLVTDLLPKYAEQFYSEVPRQIADGKYKYIEDIKQGLRFGGEAIYEVQAGKNRGKSVILVAEE